MPTEKKPSMLDVVHKWGPWFAMLLVAIVSTTGKAVWGYAEKTADANVVAARVTALESVAPKLFKRIDRLDKNIAKLTCKVDPPNCDSAMSAIGTEPP